MEGEIPNIRDYIDYMKYIKQTSEMIKTGKELLNNKD